MPWLGRSPVWSARPASVPGGWRRHPPSGRESVTRLTRYQGKRAVLTPEPRAPKPRARLTLPRQSMRERRAAGPHTSLRSQAGKDRDAIEATEEWGCSRGVCASDGRDRAPRPPPCGGWGTRRPPLSLHLPSPMTHRVCHFPLRVPRPADDSATIATFGDTFHLQTSGETVRVAVIDSAFSAWAVTVHILLCAG